MDIQRETLETDILIVGAGPAGLSVAYQLANCSPPRELRIRPEIFVMEKGSYVGAHSLSGAVMDPRGLAELIPDFKDKGSPARSAGQQRLDVSPEGERRHQIPVHAAAASRTTAIMLSR